MSAPIDIDAEIDGARRILKERRPLTAREHSRIPDLLAQAARVDADAASVLGAIYQQVTDRSHDAAMSASARSTASAMSLSLRDQKVARAAAWRALSPERRALHAIGDDHGRTSAIYRAFETFVGLLEKPVDDPPQGFEP